jgi:trk system potassium uptake protein TrkH
MTPTLAIRMLGQLLLFLAAAMVAPALLSAGYGEVDCAIAFIASALFTALIGTIMARHGDAGIGTIHRRDAFLIVAFGWVFAGLFGALPFYFSGDIPNFTNAYFETISGFTTTGSTILLDIESLNRGNLFWRSMTHWLGGMGIVVLFVAIFPQLGVGGKHLFKTEAPGPITDGLRPRIKETSALLWKIYVGLTLACALALYACGMDVFDAVNHAMSTVATAGFSTKNASVGHFDNVGIDVVTALFMLIAGVNFSLYYMASRGRWRRAINDRELWTYLAICLIATLVVTINIIERHGGLLSALRYASFQVISVVTTTGFATDNFDQYPPLSRLLLVVLMFVGGSAGSTAGGIKIFRFMVMAKACTRELTRAFRPQLVRAIRIGGSVIHEETIRAIFAFFALFLAIFVFCSLILASMGINIVTATTAVAATLANIGPGLAQVGSIENFNFIPAAGKWMLSGCMILGRLEIVTVAALLVPTFWRR